MSSSPLTSGTHGAYPGEKSDRIKPKRISMCTTDRIYPPTQNGWTAMVQHSLHEPNRKQAIARAVAATKQPGRQQPRQLLPLMHKHTTIFLSWSSCQSKPRNQGWALMSMQPPAKQPNRCSGTGAISPEIKFCTSDETGAGHRNRPFFAYAKILSYVER